MNHIPKSPKNDLHESSVHAHSAQCIDPPIIEEYAHVHDGPVFEGIFAGRRGWFGGQIPKLNLPSFANIGAMKLVFNIYSICRQQDTAGYSHLISWSMTLMVFKVAEYKVPPSLAFWSYWELNIYLYIGMQPT